MAGKGRNQILPSISCFILLIVPSYSETDTLLQGQQLTDGQWLVSAFGAFRLGFFSTQDRKDRYLGIWYNIQYDRETRSYSSDPSDHYSYNNYYENLKVVWVANRNTPILDSSGIFKIDSGDGNLKISHDGGDSIVLTSVQVATNTSATLLESGNLVLQELYVNGSKRNLWESFDYPTDTLLPGMKLGFNLETGHIWSLTSWRMNINDELPATGSYTLGMDPNGTNQLIIWWLGDVYWTSGVWLNGHFNSTRALSDYGYNFSYISNEKEKYFKYSVDRGVTPYPMLKIDSSGSVRSYEQGGWISCPQQEGCEDNSICLSDNRYFQIHYGSMSAIGFKFKESDNMTYEDCRKKCLNNCSSFAFASTNEEDDSGCEIWSTGTSFRESDERRRIYIKESIIELKENKWWLWLIIAVAGVMIHLLCSLCYLRRRKNNAKETKWWLQLIIMVGGALVWITPLYNLCYLLWTKCKAKVQSMMDRKMLLLELKDNAPQGKKNENNQGISHELHIFNFETIAAATDNFSTENKLGQGGFGPVYKGKLHDGQEIAIKRLSRSSGQGLVEFKNEAKLIAKLQHTNLVRFLGCSAKKEERILIYEYMPNKSLDFFLFDSSKKNLLDWKKRFEITEGIAQGLVYLHKYSRLRVIHRDLKASNILLDAQMNPKISDFGLARIFGRNESEANTNRVVGTYGYMSPEYAMNGVVSVKTDVYSFGVLLLEIVSGTKNNSNYHYDRPSNLVGYAWQLWNKGRGLELIDPTLDESCSPNEALRCIHVGLMCVQDHATDRPTMPDVLSMLTNENIELPTPKQPAYYINANAEDSEVPENKLENCSINEVTISIMDAR